MKSLDIEPVLRRPDNTRPDSLTPIVPKLRLTYESLPRDAAVRIREHLSLPAAAVDGVAKLPAGISLQVPGTALTAYVPGRGS